MGKGHGASREHGYLKGPTQAVLRRLTTVMRPIAMRSAGREKSSTSVVRHVGRRSGRTYETPVVAVEHDDGFLIALPYGDRTDWLKNVVASGAAFVVSHGQTFPVDLDGGVDRILRTQRTETEPAFPWSQPVSESI